MGMPTTLMPRAHLLTAALAGTLLAGAATTARAGADDALAARNVRGCGTRQRPPAAVPAPRPIADGPRVLYLNITGGTYTFDDAEATDSATDNVANVSDGPADATIPPLDTDAFDWPWIRDCVRDAYAPYDVFDGRDQADQRQLPRGGGRRPRRARLQAERPSTASPPPTTSAASPSAASPSRSASSTPRRVGPGLASCARTIAHEVGHLLALEHETLAEDEMSYVPVDEVDTKDFVDQDVTCGEYPGEPAECFCVDTATTNSAARLRQFVGEATEDDAGGGCCQSGPGGGGPAAALGAVVGVGLIGRRRRRRAASRGVGSML
jgi:uncharacterized protein (TIGR03382 family)